MTDKLIKFNNIINTLVISYIIFWFLGWFNFSIFDLFVLNYFDPATENYHFFNLYNYKSIFFSDDFNDISHGNFTNYPHFLEHLGYLFFDKNFFPYARIITVIFFYSLLFLFLLFNLYKTSNFLFSLLILTVFFGWNTHIIYFQIFKPDILYLFFGFLSLFVIFLLRGNNVSIIISTLCVCLSIYSKQTGLAFLFVSFISLLYLNFIIEDEKKLNNKLLTSTLLYSFFILIYLFIIFYILDYNSMISFLRGMQIYANKINLPHFILHIKYYFYYGYFITPLLTIISIFFVDDKKLRIFSILILLLTHLLSFNSWNNLGGFSNNFILISSISSFILVILYSSISVQKYKNFIFFVVLINSIYFTGVIKGDLNLGYKYSVDDSILLNLDKELKSSDEILSYNYSFINFVNKLKTDIQYDTLIPLLLWDIDISENNLFKPVNQKNRNSIIKKTEIISSKIKNKEYKYIIFSNDNILQIHKEINNHYHQYRSVNINMGNFRNISVNIYVPIK